MSGPVSKVRSAPARRWLALLCVYAAVPLWSQPTPLGPSFAVSPSTSAIQAGPDSARRPDGGFIVVWSGHPPQSDSAAVFGRRFDPAGEPLGSEFPVSAAEAGSYRGVRIALGADGGFLVVWQSGLWDDHDAWGRAFDPDGSPYGDPFRLHPVLPGSQQYPAVAADPAGGFVVAWSYRRPDGYPHGARARRLEFDGTPMALPFQLVADDRAGVRPSLGAVGPGEFVVAYMARDYGAPRYESWARTFSATGAVDSEFRVDDAESTYGAFSPEVAVDPAGGFIVTWSDAHFRDSSPRGRRFDANGTLLANLEIEEDTEQTTPAFAPDGTWYLSWRELGDRARGQFHAPDGTKVGAPFDVVPPGTEDWSLGRVRVAFDAASNLIFVGGNYPPAGGGEIRARLFLAGGLFLDGFESGDLARWTAATP